MGGLHWTTVMPLCASRKVSDWRVKRSFYSNWKKKTGECWTSFHQEMTALWAEYDILQTQWLCDMPRIWCHMLETAVRARVHAYWYACTSDHRDKREMSSKATCVFERRIRVKLCVCATSVSDFSPDFSLISLKTIPLLEVLQISCTTDTGIRGQITVLSLLSSQSHA